MTKCLSARCISVSIRHDLTKTSRLLPLRHRGFVTSYQGKLLRESEAQSAEANLGIASCTLPRHMGQPRLLYESASM